MPKGPPQLIKSFLLVGNFFKDGGGGLENFGQKLKF